MTSNVNYKPFFDEYLTEIETLYKLKYGKSELDDNDRNKIKAYFEEKVKPKYKPIDIEIANTCIQDLDEKPLKKDMISLYDQSRAEDCIFSLSHGVFKNKKSQILEIWSEQGVRRNEFKNKMKEELKNNNLVKASTYNGYQKMFKENANALYGVFGEASFTFYDINNISNVTGCCVQILLTTINGIEKVLGNRVIIRNEQELFDYLSYLYNKDTKPYYELEENKFELIDIVKQAVSDTNSSIEYIYSKLEKYCTFSIKENTKDKILTILNNVFTSDNIARKIIFMYNSNFEKLIKDTDIFRKMVSNDFDNYISDKYSEHAFKEASNNYKTFLELTVYDDFIQSNLLDIADNYNRSVVMLSDTDSTFCHSPLVFDNIMISVQEECKLRNISFDSELDYKVHAFKMIMFIGETMSSYFLKTIGGPKYQNSKDNRWNLKSEFLYNKILLMKVKKTYVGSVLSQEGIRLTPMKLDNKNTELVRSRYNFITKDFLKEFYNEMIMKEDKKLDISKLVDIRDKYREKFREITSNYMECSKLGTRSDYKLEAAYKNDPFTIYQYKAAVTFNALYPEHRTLPGDKTSLLPIKDVEPFKFEYFVNKSDIMEVIHADNSILEGIDKKFKTDTIELSKFQDYMTKEDLVHLLAGDYMTKLKPDYNKKRQKAAVDWYIKSYGLNDDLKNRFHDLFYKKEKSDLDIKLINVLFKDMNINYLAFSYYSSMPETMLDLVNADKMLLDSIDDRLVRVFDALGIKVYQRNDLNFITNIIEV